MRIGYRAQWRRDRTWRGWLFGAGKWWVVFGYSDGNCAAIASYDTEREADLAAERMARV